MLGYTVRMVKKSGMKIQYGSHVTPFGWYTIAMTGGAICYASFSGRADDVAARKDILKKWPGAILVKDEVRIGKVIGMVFAARRYPKTFKVLCEGTDFQMKVWKALIGIPEGTVTTYAAIAKKIGSPKAVRAVGTACGKNTVAYLVPCHRVLASDGRIGGYRWGAKRKKEMLAWEIAARKSA